MIYFDSFPDVLFLNSHPKDLFLSVNISDGLLLRERFLYMKKFYVGFQGIDRCLRRNPLRSSRCFGNWSSVPLSGDQNIP